MAEGEIKNGQVQEKEEKEQEKEQEKEAITLTPEQYSALLDRIAELEEIALSKAKKEEKPDVDSLLTEAKSAYKKEPEFVPKDLDSMSNAELVNYVLEMARPALMELETKVETLRVLREIDKCESKYEDFWEYEEEIREIASKNPSLSIEQAYKLAKFGKEGQEGEKKKKGKETVPTSRTILHTLPPKPVPGGEKTGVAARSTEASQVKTLRDAALRAWEEVVGKGKESF